ncbi:homocitrate synthase lys21 [Cryomyces antarcticus]|uniref:Homocitrate synthase lys21 n=1 Tax=Cryomyces antarcticus TaxID=329879 RepID=A0ABR0KU86_9PEZI|nr:homocitrate synthase lys21 [Cryomyces antarcticus]KAK5131118.1 homocitrate synthase lys21 [Cryomyces antarcticus]
MTPAPVDGGAQANGHTNGHTNGTNGHTNGTVDAPGHEGYTGVVSRQNPHIQNRANNPYQPVGDFLSNISRFQIIESTLREGEQASALASSCRLQD